MSRKDTLRAMLSRRDERLPAGNSGQVTGPGRGPQEEPKPIQHVRSGAVGAMGRSLGQIAHAAEQARALIANGAAVVEIHPDKIDGSFVSDRLESDGADFDLLVDAIRETGQRSPILVRPHPDKHDRYQIAFGHRRVRVAARLGRLVRAVVQNLSDEEVVIIQGQENSARTDLSYIERGLFAVELETRGFDRRVIMAALSMEKTQLSKMLSLTHSIPRDLAAAIGSAPKAGRPRWTALVERLSGLKDKRVLDELLVDPTFRTADSDTRFLRVFTSLGPKTSDAHARSTPWTAEDGRRVAIVERKGRRLAVIIDETEEPAFGEFLASQLPALHREFRRQQKEEGADTQSP
jgi:ParB family chromosome partitioning protein